MTSFDSVRWGLRLRVFAVAGLGMIAGPVMLTSVASAGPGSGAPKPAPAVQPAPPAHPTTWGDATDDSVSKGADGGYQAQQDPGSLYTVTNAIGARAVWRQRDANGLAITGSGVSVALLDSGVAPVPGLDGAGKVIDGPDLSLETNSPDLQGLDTFGHGTHLASIIAANDDPSAVNKNGSPTGATPSQEMGVAPGASLVALKLATANGSTDVSEIIAALDWVTEHAQDNGNNIRVVNLAFGTDSIQPYQLDPLATAAENAWHHGIVVVVSAGNEGPTAGQLTDPAIDPYVIAVGASDPQSSVKGWKNPSVASFSSVGNSARSVDLLAPGTSITGLRDPGSYVDVNNPQGLVDGDTTGRLFRGSGTSQAAAVVSGAVALLEQANPDITPDQVKAALMATADPLKGVPTLAQGAGQIDVDGAVSLVRQFTRIGSQLPAQLQAQLASIVQTYPVATGLGTLEGARGGSHLVDPDNGVVLQGEMDVQGQPWVPEVWAAASAAGTAWTGGIWNSARWSGDSWSGANWQSTGWDSARWSSARWSDADWDSARWSSARWSDASWDSARWSSARWSDAGWDSARWSADSWS